MLTETQTRAVDMLFELTDEEIARKLKIKRATLESWKRKPEFAQALRRRLMENRRAAARILSRLYVEASRELEALIRSDDDKNKPKAIIELLKVSGLFKELGLEGDDDIGNLLERLADEQEEVEPGEED
ncbi:MAG TPA: hypothetical protein VMX94_00845 [Armatimonadota bacterium]|nr:hypothetical protein [Armatimonadota bacterium]